MSFRPSVYLSEYTLFSYLATAFGTFLAKSYVISLAMSGQFQILYSETDERCYQDVSWGGWQLLPVQV